jgi:hypothetical protein
LATDVTFFAFALDCYVTRRLRQGWNSGASAREAY